MSVSNPQTPLVERGKDNKLRAFRVKDFQYTSIGQLILYRLIKNRDIKIVITSKGTTTGTGKTQLAIILARTVHRMATDLFGRKQTDWPCENRAFLAADPYKSFYETADAGDVALVDELEIIVDNRRSMSDRNVEFSHAWQKYRDKNVVTIATAPGLHSLDKRIKSNSDLWINVITQGQANTYYLTYHDFEGYWIPRRLRKGRFKEQLYWLAIDNDPHYKYLQHLKHNTDIELQSDRYGPQDLQEAERSAREEIAIKIFQAIQDGDSPIDPNKPIGELTQMEIGQLVGPGSDGYSQQTISKIKRQSNQL